MNNTISTFAIYTLGCKVNLYESNLIRNDLLSNGISEVDFNGYSDLYIINTCSVTSTADSKSRNIISRAKRNNPNSIVVVMGCFSQVSKDECAKLNVDIVIGNKYKNNILDLIKQYLIDKKQIVKVDNLLIEKEFEESKISSFKSNTRAFIKIQDGCNYMCSYCIIPFSRGRQRSKPLEKIIDEIINLVNENYKEIVLTGVNTAGYLDKNGNDFYTLLKKINDIEMNFRIRISSIEPFQISDEIINLVCSNKKRFCQHWHLCLQSGSDNVLENMNRKYTFNEFLEIVDKIKLKSEYATFTTDYIVGFPSETDDDHIKSLNNVQKILFLDMHIFTYSERKGTAASKLKKIDPKIISKRFKEIEKVKKEMNIKILKKYIGKTLEVLFEINQENYWKGYSSEYIEVIVKNKENLKNKLLNVKIKSIRFNTLVGEIA